MANDFFLEHIKIQTFSAHIHKCHFPTFNDLIFVFAVAVVFTTTITYAFTANHSFCIAQVVYPLKVCH